MFTIIRRIIIVIILFFLFSIGYWYGQQLYYKRQIINLQAIASLYEKQIYTCDADVDCEIVSDATGPLGPEYDYQGVRSKKGDDSKLSDFKKIKRQIYELQLKTKISATQIPAHVLMSKSYEARCQEHLCRAVLKVGE